ncbi:MAG: TlpA family protein disulfide reductase [Cyclobacteriaceae bacterium]|nr:TlpA family protein disulfide reductase [Cyclobacteriaceae bacterium]
MNLKNKALLGISILAFIAATWWKAASDRPAVSLASQAELINVMGQEVSLSDFKGKVVFINNWASWCPPCVAEMASIQRLSESLAGQGVAFVMVSYDKDHDKAIDFMKRRGYNLPVYFPGDQYPFPTDAIPSTIVLDAQGGRVLAYEGMRDYTDPGIVSFLRAATAGIPVK